MGFTGFLLLPAYAECPVRKDGDECEKGILRSSCMPKSVPACTKRFCEGRFGEHVSVGGYASAGFAEAVKMPCAEAQGIFIFNNNTEVKRSVRGRAVFSSGLERIGAKLKFIIHHLAGIRLHLVDEHILVLLIHRLKRLRQPDIHLQLFDGLTAYHGS